MVKSKSRAETEVNGMGICM
jgi:hypothetical protein